MTTCEHVAEDGIRCPRPALGEAKFCEDHDPAQLEALRERLAAQKAKRLQEQAQVAGAQAEQETSAGELELEQQRSRLKDLQDAEQAYENVIKEAKGRVDQLNVRVEQLRVLNLTEERNNRDLKARATQLKSRIVELQEELKLVEQAQHLPLPCGVTLAKADALLRQALDKQLESELTAEDLERAREARETAKEYRLLYTFLERLKP